MVRHIVMWNFADGFSDEENRKNAERIKAELENLKTLIDGIVEINVYIDILPTSNKNIVLNSLFESKEAFESYVVHPAHKKAGEFVRAATKDRACVDYCE